MTEEIQKNTSESRPRSRRAMLAGALGALGAWAMAAAGRPTPVQAIEGDTIHVGEELTGTSVTKITNTTSHATLGTALQGVNAGGGIGVKATSGSYIGSWGSSGSYIGVYGYTVSGTAGVYAESNTAKGLYALGSTNYGVYCETFSSSHAGVYGQSPDATGVQGYSGSSSEPAAKAKTGVFGYAAQDNFSRGVTGESPAGIGVYGISSTGYGGYFGGKVHTTHWYEMSEVATPPAPLANRARLFVKDNGAGKTQLCVRFATGAVQVIATQP